MTNLAPVSTIAATALDSFEDTVYKSLVQFTEQNCNAQFPVRALQDESKCRQWMPGTLLTFKDGTCGFTALQGVVHKDSATGQLKVCVTKFGESKAVKMTVTALTHSVDACILGVLSSGAPNAPGFKAGAAAQRVQYLGGQEHISVVAAGDPAKPMLAVHTAGTAVVETLPLDDALARYAVKWVGLHPAPPENTPQQFEHVDMDQSGTFVAAWIHMDMLARIYIEARPRVLTDAELAQRAGQTDAAALASKASDAIYNALERFRLEAAGSQSAGVTLSHIAAFICALAGCSQWMQVCAWMIAGTDPLMHVVLEQIVTLAGFVSSSAVKAAYAGGMSEGETLTTMAGAAAAGAALRTKLLPVDVEMMDGGAPADGAPTQQGLGVVAARQQQPVVNLYQDARQMPAAGGQGAGATTADAATDGRGMGPPPVHTRQPAVAQQPLGQQPATVLPPPGHPPPVTHTYTPEAAGAHVGGRPPASPGDATPGGVSAGGGTAAPGALHVCRQFAPRAPAASPLTDVRMWMDMLGGGAVQTELAGFLGIKLRPALSPLDSTHAASVGFKHLLKLFNKLVEEGDWYAEYEAPASWADAKQRLAELFEEADASADREREPATQHHTFAGGAPAGGAAPLTAAPTAEDFLKTVQDGRGRGLGDGLRSALKKEMLTDQAYFSVAPKEMVKARSACATEIARPMCGEGFIKHESALGTAASRGVTAVQEMARFTHDKRHEMAQAGRALFQAANMVAEKTGAAAVNIVDAVSASRLVLRAEVRKARGGSFMRADVMTPDRVKKCDALAEGIARGDIDFDAMVEMLGGVAPSKHRPIAGEDRAYGLDGNPQCRNDIRDAMDVLVKLLLAWWRDVLDIDAGDEDDFGIKLTLKQNRDLELPALRKLMQQGFTYTRERFMADRESTQRKPPNVLRAWEDADEYDAVPLAEDQKVKAATLQHMAAQQEKLMAPVQKLLKDQEQRRAEFLKEISELKAQVRAATKRKGVVPDDDDDAEPAAKRRGTPDKKVTPAAGASMPPLPAAPIGARGELFAHLGAVLKGGCPTGEWPCLSVALTGRCRGAPDCRACSKSKTAGKGDDEPRNMIKERLKELIDKKKLEGQALDMANSAPRRS